MEELRRGEKNLVMEYLGNGDRLFEAMKKEKIELRSFRFAGGDISFGRCIDDKMMEVLCGMKTLESLRIERGKAFLREGKSLEKAIVNGLKTLEINLELSHDGNKSFFKFLAQNGEKLKLETLELSLQKAGDKERGVSSTFVSRSSSLKKLCLTSENNEKHSFKEVLEGVEKSTFSGRIVDGNRR